MYIYRDLTNSLLSSQSMIQVLVGPRQCGKSTLFSALYIENQDEKKFHEITFDDFQMRQLANKDPGLFIQQFPPPLVLDEVQYVPNLFSELKKYVDTQKRLERFKPETTKKSDFPLFCLTGSNQILMDKNVKESLAGRATYYDLNTLSVHEILNTFPSKNINEIIFKGGWPELYISDIATVQYLNDYIRTFVEKDIVLSAGITKLTEFHTVLGLLSARTGQLVEYSTIANDSDVSSTTVKEWISLLERSRLIYTLKPFHTNLSKRLIKSPKLYFLDTGLATRLQGWSEAIPLYNSPQIGSLFETLVLAEIIKFIHNFNKDWEVYYYRTKEGEEIDFVIRTQTDNYFCFEAKRSIHSLYDKKSYPKSYIKLMNPKHPLVIVTAGGNLFNLSDLCKVIPINELTNYLSKLD